MATDLLQKEITGLSDEDLYLLIEYAKYLKYRMTVVKTSVKTNSSKRKIGFLAEAFVSIASDFDETPGCMGEYV